MYMLCVLGYNGTILLQLAANKKEPYMWTLGISANLGTIQKAVA